MPDSDFQKNISLCIISGNSWHKNIAKTKDTVFYFCKINQAKAEQETSTQTFLNIKQKFGELNPTNYRLISGIP
jgi:hypothetical protein